MKVKLEKNYKEYYTLTDLEHAKKVIKFEKDDESTAADWAKYAVSEALKDTKGCLIEIVRAEAETVKNLRVKDAYGEGTGAMDVWIDALAKTSEGYLEIGAYLSDIWQTGGDYYYKNRMAILEYPMKIYRL